MIAIAGHFFPAKSSLQQVSTLTINDDGRVDVTNKELQSLLSGVHHLVDLDISPRLGNTPRFIQFDNGDRFETQENDSVDQVLKQNRHGLLYQLLHKMESHLVFVLLVTLLTSIVVLGFVKYGVPATATLIAKLLPVETSQYLGQGSLEIMDKSIFEPSELDSQRKQELLALFKRYSAPYGAHSVTVLFRKSDDIGANAMALPDGHIIFTDDMVNQAEQDEELIAIFGHELGHLVHRHMLRRVIQDSMFTLVLVLITGDVSSVSSVITAIPTVLLELAYSRKFETEADDFAYDFLLQNNLSPVYFAQIMQRLESERGDQHPEKKSRDGSADHSQGRDYSSYLSTHPATQQRIQRFLQSES